MRDMMRGNRNCTYYFPNQPLQAAGVCISAFCISWVRLFSTLLPSRQQARCRSGACPRTGRVRPHGKGTKKRLIIFRQFTRHQQLAEDKRFALFTIDSMDEPGNQCICVSLWSSITGLACLTHLSLDLSTTAAGQATPHTPL
jgi:hypothetical protein